MILSFRLGASAAAVLFMAVMVKLSASRITEFTVSQVPWIWSLVASWLKPPYLYLVINCIIITILASSKLQKHLTNYSEPNKFPEDNYYGNGKFLQSKLVNVIQPLSPLQNESKSENSDEFDLTEYADESVPETKSPVLMNDVCVDDSNATSALYSGNSTTVNADSEEIDDVSILKHQVSKMSKPPSSARFVHQEIVKANPEGTKTLRVSKPKRELDTLESTWKTITNIQPVPLTRQHTGRGNLQDHHKMIKSEMTFNDQHSSHRIDNMSKRLTRSSGPGKLRRDPSLSQDELNKRAEAFINRFKEDMRLQRKESLNRYVETINNIAY